LRAKLSAVCNRATFAAKPAGRARPERLDAWVALADAAAGKEAVVFETPDVLSLLRASKIAADLRLDLEEKRIWKSPAVKFDPKLIDCVRDGAKQADFTTREMADGMDRFWRMRSWLDLQTLPSERRARVLPYIRQWVEGAASLRAAEVFTGYSQMAALREAAIAACQTYDFVLSPVSPVASFPAEWAGPTNDPARPFEHIAFTLPFNMSEQPAASIGCGFTRSGLPIGLQIAGHRFDDLGVLQLARAWERLRGPQPAWPM